MATTPRKNPLGTVSIPRALSKLGACSRSDGERLVEAGRVRINGVTVRDKTFRIRPEDSLIEVDGAPVARAARVYLALNKPRGLVTTRVDPRGPSYRRAIDFDETIF